MNWNSLRARRKARQRGTERANSKPDVMAPLHPRQRFQQERHAIILTKAELRQQLQDALAYTATLKAGACHPAPKQ